MSIDTTKPFAGTAWPLAGDKEEAPALEYQYVKDVYIVILVPLHNDLLTFSALLSCQC
jgi:hypothetical protein